MKVRRSTQDYGSHLRSVWLLPFVAAAAAVVLTPD
jgi:paraquat-inducible protein B